MKKFCDRLLISLSVLTALFPFALAVSCAFPNLFGGWGILWEGHGYSLYFLPNVVHHLHGGLMLCCLWLICSIIVSRLFLRIDEKKALLSVFLAVLLSRGVLAILGGVFSSPISDFQESWQRACSGLLTSEYNHEIYWAWVCYSFLQRIFVLTFGDSYALWLLVGALCNAITGCAIYLIAKEVFQDHKTSVVASVLYAVYPSGLAYVITATPEHLNIAALSVAVYAFIYCMKRELGWRNLMFMLAGGGAAGLGCAVKPIFPIFLTAMLMTAILKIISGNNPKASAMKSAMLIGVMVIAEFAVVMGVTLCTERMFNCRLRGMDPTPHYLDVGLNRQGEGQIHLGNLSRMWTTLVTNGVDRAEASRRTYLSVMDDWNDHWNEVPSFLAKKMVWAWQDDNIPFHYAVVQVGEKLAQASKVGNPLEGANAPLANQVYEPATARFIWVEEVRQFVQTAGFVCYLVLMLCGVTGVFWYARTRAIDWRYGFVCLLVLGYFGLMVLSEAASRYKCLVMPYVFVLTAPFVAKLFLYSPNVGKDDKMWL